MAPVRCSIGLRADPAIRVGRAVYRWHCRAASSGGPTRRSGGVARVLGGRRARSRGLLAGLHDDRAADEQVWAVGAIMRAERRGRGDELGCEEAAAPLPPRCARDAGLEARRARWLRHATTPDG